MPTLSVRLRGGRWGAVLLAALVLAGCRESTAVWLAPDATAERLAFVLGTERGHERPVSVLLRVDRCDEPIRRYQPDRALWIAQVDASRVVYGESDGGVYAQVPPQPLVPGCYRAAITGGGAVMFEVTAAGEVREIEPPDR